MKRIPVLALLLASSLVLAGCSLPGSQKTVSPSPSPVDTHLTPQTAPFTTLTITADKQTGLLTGHTFTMNISGISPQNPSLEYLILYSLPDGREQGIPGTIQINNQAQIKRDDLLMGSCSKTCRFDDGVTQGTIQLTYRDAAGNSLGDILGDWHLQQGDTSLTSVDGNFEYDLKKKVQGWFVTMASLGLPENLQKEVLAGPYTITLSNASAAPGVVKFLKPTTAKTAQVYYWDGSAWFPMVNGLTVTADSISVEADNIGTFVLVSS